MVPVDLNSLLYFLETVLAQAKFIAHDNKASADYARKADRRRLAIDKYCWNKTLKYYTDFNFRTVRHRILLPPQGCTPFVYLPKSSII